MSWQVRVARGALRNLGSLPGKDQRRITAALAEMTANPFAGDVARLKTRPLRFRRRVGAYRIFFRVDPGRALIEVSAITRRTSTTYRGG